jgi:hypothetical protein
MVKKSDIARDWGCTPQYVHTQVKKGCPTDSLEHARMWREARRQRSSHSGPPGSRDYSDDSRPAKTGPNGHILEDIGDDMLLGSKEAVRQAWRLLREALVEGKAQKIGAWLSLYTRSVEANVKAESMIREEQERQKVLIPLTEAQAEARKGYEIILQRLNALPQNISAKLNPTDPAWALDILEQECAAIIEDAQKAFA